MTKQKRYHARKPWARFVHWSKDRCRRQANYSGMENTLTTAQAEALWHRDCAEAMKWPSLDRRDPDLGYTFDNCQFMEFPENVAKSHRDRAMTEFPFGENVANSEEE